MTKNKLQRFSEAENLNNMIQPTYADIDNKKHKYYGNWSKDFFGNDNPIVVEFGCGKGEYSLAQAKLYPNKNYIGVDIKGARMWVGAKEAINNKINNVAFLRTKIELISAFFKDDEVSEIWITFPDPHEKNRHRRKRIASPRFLNLYRNFLIDNGIVHLKTDNSIFYNYTVEIVKHNKLKILQNTDDLYNSDAQTELLGVKTFYESKFLEVGKTIKYLKFELPKTIEIDEPEQDEE